MRNVGRIDAAVIEETRVLQKENFMELKSILKGRYTPEEYLARQRELHRRRCEEYVAEIRRNESADAIKRDKAEAEHAMQNMLILPGTGGVRMHVGTPPAWSDCRSDDEEYLWVLNRMGYFKALLRLYLALDEEVYARKVLDDMENWIDTCPMHPLPTTDTTPDEMRKIRNFYAGLTPWRSLEVGIRMFDSWNFAYDSLLFSDLMTPELHAKIVSSFYQHAVVLRDMSPRYWPDANHNHYIHEMLGLFEVACLFPDFEESDAWREFAANELARCAKAQFTPDGGQIEGSPHYHYCCLTMFFDFLLAARSFDVTVHRDVLDVMKNAVDYMLAVLGSDGIIAPIGDSPFNKVAERIASYYYRCYGELGPAAKLFCIQPSHDASIIPEELQVAARALAESAPGEDNRQRQINQYFARTSWRADASHFGFICHSPVFNGHSHQDLMSFVLYLNGDPVVVDPSYYTYRECEERKLFKSPEYHSTLTFDNKPPFEYTGRWSFSPQKEGGVRGFYSSRDFFAADASHHCYDPDYHKRLCALVGEDVFLVADDVVNLTETDLRIYFHMDDPALTVEGGRVHSERVRVLLPEGVTAEAVASEKAPRNDVTEPTKRLILTDTSHKSRLYLTLFTKRADVSNHKIERSEGGVKISYTQGEKTVTLLWSFSSSLKKL